MLRRSRWLLALTTCVAACSDLKVSDSTDAASAPGTPDGDATTDGGGPFDGAGADGGGRPATDSGVGPGQACRKVPLDCLDPGPANVIEVPTEATLTDAFANAKANDIVQVKGQTLGAGWAIPAYVTLRGCNGAGIGGAIRFAGSGGAVEGFVVSGSIVANATGSYVVRQNRFVAGGAPNEAGVSGRSIDALVSASVTLVVDANVFDGRAAGVEARTSYDTMTHAVDVTVRNNVFLHVKNPFVASEAGLVGVVVATIEQNTFFDFDTAIALGSVDRTTKTSGNLFAQGTTAISGSAYEAHHSMVWQVTTPAGTPPLAGTFAVGDPAFVDAGKGDLRLGGGSAAVDKIPNGYPVPGEDHQGCPRPAGAPGALPQSDIGAFESQP